MDTTEHTLHTRRMLFILALILFVASLIGYFVSQKMDSGRGVSTTNYELRTTPSPIPTLIPYPVKGQFVLKERSGLTKIKQGTPFTLDIIATSSKDTVAGYDAIFSYDKTAFERQSLQNRSEQFRIFSYEREGHTSISATKNLTVNTDIRFSESPILTLSFIAKKTGTYTFSLKPVGNESSKLVNESAQVTYPETQDIRLEIIE